MVHATNCIALEGPATEKTGTLRKQAKDLQSGFVNATPEMKGKLEAFKLAKTTESVLMLSQLLRSAPPTISPLSKDTGLQTTETG